MIILYSAFECSPNIGSDAYVGWSWAKEMSKRHDVHVLTNSLNKQSIEDYSKIERVNATFHYIDVPSWIEKVFRGRKLYFIGYYFWQKNAYKYAKELSKGINFDIVHHVSIADFRVIGELWKLNKPFIFGPVGGGQETPKVLKPYIKKHLLKEYMRSVINHIMLLSPKYNRAVKNTNIYFASNDETLNLVKNIIHHPGTCKFYRLCELGVENEKLCKREYKKRNKEIHILVAGRLMYRKGIELLLDALTELQTVRKFVVDIYGGGQQEKEVRQQIQERNLQDVVILHGRVAFDNMPKIYANSDFVVLPSLRETTGTAVFEALTYQLPIIALNQNGVKYIIENDSGILVDVSTKQNIITGLSNAIKYLIENDEERIAMGITGYEKMKSLYTWEYKCGEMEKIYRKLIENKNSSD